MSFDPDRQRPGGFAQVARWTTATRNVLDDAPDLVQTITAELMTQLNEAIADRPAWVPPGTPVEIHMSEQHPEFFTRNAVVFIAEVRALDLRDPNPFPRLRPFYPRLERAIDYLRGVIHR